MREKQREDELAKRNGSKAPEPEPASGDDEFARFEDLARKLAKVPKAEVDEKRKTA